jgi:hypothetical protein
MDKTTRMIRWGEICKVAVALGEIQENNNRAECMRLIKRLNEAIEVGRIRKVKRGLYEIDRKFWQSKG